LNIRYPDLPSYPSQHTCVFRFSTSLSNPLAKASPISWVWLRSSKSDVSNGSIMSSQLSRLVLLQSSCRPCRVEIYGVGSLIDRSLETYVSIAPQIWEEKRAGVPESFLPSLGAGAGTSITTSRFTCRDLWWWWVSRVSVLPISSTERMVAVVQYRLPSDGS
jgi:hypothetical protein